MNGLILILNQRRVDLFKPAVKRFWSVKNSAAYQSFLQRESLYMGYILQKKYDEMDGELEEQPVSNN